MIFIRTTIALIVCQIGLFGSTAWATIRLFENTDSIMLCAFFFGLNALGGTVAGYLLIEPPLHRLLAAPAAGLVAWLIVVETIETFLPSLTGAGLELFSLPALILFGLGALLGGWARAFQRK